MTSETKDNNHIDCVRNPLKTPEIKSDLDVDENKTVLGRGIARHILMESNCPNGLSNITSPYIHAEIASVAIGEIISNKTWNCIQHSINITSNKDHFDRIENAYDKNESLTYAEAQKIALDITGINFDHNAHNPF